MFLILKVAILKYLLPVVVGITAIAASYSFGNKEDAIRFVRPKGWPKPAYNFAKNKLTEPGFYLGRKLFYDPLLSADGTISCASCHTQWSAFTHVDHGLSHGINGLKGRRNSMTIFNLAWNTSFMWDGGINNLEVQPLGPITNATEMGTTLAEIVRKLDTAAGYKARFYAAFGDSAITGQRVLKAMAQFLVMLESYNSKYDKYIRGEAGGDFTDEEKNGLELFRRNCASCHPEPLFTDYGFKNTGLQPDADIKDYGRMGITGDSRDSLKFKTPSLRNIGMSYPYMHDGRFRTLRQSIDHYVTGITGGPTLAVEYKTPIVLNEKNKTDLIAFLKTLTDDVFLTDKRYREEGK